MKKVIIAILALMMVSLWTTQSFSGERELHGMLIGAGSGAVIGHAIGGNPEAALIGSAIGSVVGVALGSAHPHGLPLPPPPPGFIPPPPPGFIPPPLPGFIPPPPPVRNHYRYSRHHRYNGYREYYPRCRTIETTHYRHGRPYTVSKRICRDDRGYTTGRHRIDREYYHRYERRHRHEVRY